MSAMINLRKGEGINLTKTKPSLSNIRVGLGWNENGNNIDLDASVFVCGNRNGETKLISERHFVFYNNSVGANGAVTHKGDNKTGAGDGDDEVVSIDLTTVPAEVNKIVFTVTIHEAEARKQNFGQVRNSYIRIVDDASGQEIAKYELDEDFSIETAVEFGRLYKKDGKWKFEASGIGYKEDLSFFLSKYYMLLVLLLCFLFFL